MSNKFTLAENPNKPGCRAESGAGLFIIHHIAPVAIIEVNLLDSRLPATKTSACYTYINTDGIPEHWQLTIQFCYQSIGAPDIDISKLLTRAWHWYMAYLKWEDGNIDTAYTANKN